MQFVRSRFFFIARIHRKSAKQRAGISLSVKSTRVEYLLLYAARPLAIFMLISRQ
jgi:hypothetical protein